MGWALALLDPTSSWSGDCYFASLPLDDVENHIADLNTFEWLLVDCETKLDIKVERVLQMKRAGVLTPKIVMATYKGWEFVPGYHDVIDAYVVHARSYVVEGCPSIGIYVPLAVAATPAQAPTFDVFVGGRKDRNFQMAFDAVQDYRVRMVSDRIPQYLGCPAMEGFDVTPYRIPNAEYRDIMSHAAVVLVPLQPTTRPHGHSDVARALRARVPVVVTRGATCDDYIDHQVNGYLCDYSAKGMREGVEWCLAHRAEMSGNIEPELHSFTYYNGELRDWMWKHGQ